ncbi:MAG: hypothetical protein WA810_09465 [Maribacter sp.]
MIRKIMKFLGFLILVGIVAFGVLYYIYNEPLPAGESGPEADALAYRMLDALGSEQYQNTKHIAWSFRDESHRYLWNRTKEKVSVSWDEYEVMLDLITPDSSIAFKDGERLSYDETLPLIETAQSYFNNDSFWLVAPYKVFDKGTERYLVTQNDGSEALLVTYTQGGDTPGDSYLWIIEPSGIPKSFKMWVNIIPIGGLEATWEGWKKTESGALLPTSHSFGPMTISMGEVSASK